MTLDFGEERRGEERACCIALEVRQALYGYPGGGRAMSHRDGWIQQVRDSMSSISVIFSLRNMAQLAARK
jgi:hypothetical protein